MMSSNGAVLQSLFLTYNGSECTRFEVRSCVLLLAGSVWSAEEYHKEKSLELVPFFPGWDVLSGR